MSESLVIDCREKKIIDELSSRQVLYSVKSLDIGDIIFNDKDGQIAILIERKTVNDLKESIKDGRLREQRDRILKSGIPSERVVYLVEGDINKSTNTDTLMGSMINMMFRDNIKIYKTNSLKETCDFIVKMQKKMNDDLPSFLSGEYRVKDYSETLKKKKKDNMNSRLLFILCLSQIPSVSDIMAKSISKEYNSLYDLFLVYEATDEKDRETLLKDIIIDGKRKIGVSASKKIYEFIYGMVNDTEQIE